jgi:hypothetical protein
MDAFGQLNAFVWVTVFLTLFLFAWVLPIVAIWALFRFIRDLRAIRGSLEQLAAQPRPLPEAPAPREIRGGVSNSAFGR